MYIICPTRKTHSILSPPKPPPCFHPPTKNLPVSACDPIGSCRSLPWSLVFFVFYWCLAGKLGSWEVVGSVWKIDSEIRILKQFLENVQGENEALKIWEGFGSDMLRWYFPLKELGDVKKVPAVNFPGCTPKTQDGSEVYEAGIPDSYKTCV